jgi:hypothetical protein
MHTYNNRCTNVIPWAVAKKLVVGVAVGYPNQDQPRGPNSLCIIMRSERICVVTTGVIRSFLVNKMLHHKDAIHVGFLGIIRIVRRSNPGARTNYIFELKPDDCTRSILLNSCVSCWHGSILKRVVSDSAEKAQIHNGVDVKLLTICLPGCVKDY